MLGDLGGFAGLMLSAWLLNEGLRAEEAYDARAVARPPAIPRKLFAAVADRRQRRARGLHRARPEPRHGAGLRRDRHGGASRGLRPRPDEEEGHRRHRRLFHRAGRPGDRPGRGAGAPDRRRRAADRRPACWRGGSSGCATRPARCSASSRRTRATSIARGPSSASTCSGCATRRSSSPISGRAAATPRARTATEDLLGDLETSFTTQRTHLLEDNRSDLDIEIEVLRERLQQDGLIAR